jgi:hypothetical protein
MFGAFWVPYLSVSGAASCERCLCPVDLYSCFFRNNRFQGIIKSFSNDTGIGRMWKFLLYQEIVKAGQEERELAEEMTIIFKVFEQ